MKLQRLAFIFILLLPLFSCGGGSDGGGGESAETENGGPNEPDTPPGTGDSRPAELVYDSELTAEERRALDNSTAALGSLPVDGSRIRGFSQVFGGNRSSNVVSYFERRVNYALSGSTPVESRIVENPADPISPGLSAETVASNLGTALWLGSVINGTGTIDFLINDKEIPVTSSRVGIMQFGAFSRFGRIQQVNTLVHEARHSDCTGGLSSEDIASWRSNELPEDNSCGHVHVICPPGHPYAGIPACDDQAWGAYTVGTIHSAAIAQSCESCSESDKTVAEQVAIDSLSRLLFDVGAMLDGNLGPADMSSSNSVGE